MIFERFVVSGWIFALALFAVGISAKGGEKPDARRAFEELKIYDPLGRSWRQAKEEWLGAKQRIENDPEWRRWYLKEKGEVDSWIQTARDRTEWAAGWSQDGVSPKNGSSLIWTNKIPGEEVKFLSSRSDPKVEVTPKILGWWVVTFRARNADMMVRAARIFRLTGDPLYADWVVRQVNFYASHYQEWKPRKEGARLFGQTLTEATNLIKFAEALRLLGDYVEPEMKRLWWEKLFEPEVKVLSGNFQMVHNIACWQRGAVAQIALLYEREDVWKDAIDGSFGIRQQAREGITKDYLWQEQSFVYNEYAIKAFYSLFQAVGLYGRSEDLADEMAKVQNMMLAPVYLRFPDGNLPNLSDAIGVRKGVNIRLFADTYRVFPTPLGLREAAKRRNWDTLLDPPEGRSEKAILPEVKSANLEGMRLALLKAGNWQVFFQYGQVSKSHAQAEALNYSAFYDDTDLTHDAGTVKYGSQMHKNYFRRGLSHNVPLVNGEGAQPPQPGELIKFSANPPIVAVSQPNFRRDGRAYRSIEIRDDKLIVATTVESQQPAKLGMALHLQGEVVWQESFRPDESFAENRPRSFGYWKDVKRAAFDSEAAFDVKYDDIKMRVTIASDKGFILWHAVTPDRASKLREGLYLEVTGTKASFTTTWEKSPNP